jgi:hypothetical protein
LETKNLANDTALNLDSTRLIIQNLDSKGFILRSPATTPLRPPYGREVVFQRAYLKPAAWAVCVDYRWGKNEVKMEKRNLPDRTWADFFEMMKRIEMPKDFMADRKEVAAQKRKLF